MAYRPISDYGVIGDMHSAALVSGDGSIDWLCLPRFDSPSVFAQILDDGRGGRFQLRPAGKFQSHQHYLPDNNVLVTRFETDSGVAIVADFMPITPDITQGEHKVIRILRGESGEVQMAAHFEPRLDYARGETALSVEGNVATGHLGGDAVSLSTLVPLKHDGPAATARFTLRKGDNVPFIVSWNADPPPDAATYDAHARLGQTEAFWTFVAQDWNYAGRWQSIVKRSMLALHLLIYAPTGAVCAAATTSLPEQIGGVRNWDYRFTWIRDAALTMDIFHRLGHTAYTRPFIDWMGNYVTGEDPGHELRAFYSITPTQDGAALVERELDHLQGYRGSAPVRIGNAACQQVQLDVFGEMMLAIDSYERAGGDVDDTLWRLAHYMVESACRRWREKDVSIWEFRTEPRHFTFTKLMCWVALDRGLRLAHACKRPVDFERWKRTREEIRQDILENGWDEARRSFVQAYGGDCLDAALLFIPMVGFLPGRDPRVLATIDAVWRELGVDGLVHRYRPEHADDGLPGNEGTFNMCSLWMAGSLVAAGRVDEALALFEKLITYGNHAGLYSEMLDPATQAYLGNYPQAFTHIALIHTARNLDRALTALEQGKVVAAG